MTRLLVSIDNGFGNIKIFFKHEGMEYKRVFESRVEETTLKTESTLLINEKLYDFSDAQLVVDRGHNTKEDPIHRVLRNKALYEVYKITGIKDFDVVTNCSLDSYKDDRGESIKQMYDEEKTIDVEDYFGNKVTLNVNETLCQPETLSGLFICNEVNLATDDIIGLDIGTKNNQLLSIVNAKLQKTHSSTLGMDEIYRACYDLVKTVNSGIKSSENMKDYLKRTHEKSYEPIKEIDEAIYKALEKDIFTEIDRELNAMESMFSKIVLMGGGCNYLQRFLNKKLGEERKSKLIYTKDGFYANVIGMYAKAERLLQYKDGVKIKSSNSSSNNSSKGKSSKATPKKTTGKKVETKIGTGK